MVRSVKTSVVWISLSFFTAVAATDYQPNGQTFTRDQTSTGPSLGTNCPLGVISQDLDHRTIPSDSQWWDACKTDTFDYQAFFTQEDSYLLDALNNVLTSDSGSSSDPYQSSSSDDVWSLVNWDLSQSPLTSPERAWSDAQDERPSKSSETRLGSLPPPSYRPLPLPQAQLPPVIVRLDQSMKWLDVPSLDASYALTLWKPYEGIWSLDQLNGSQAQSNIDYHVHEQIQAFHEAIDDYYSVLIQREREQGGTLNARDHLPFPTQLGQRKLSYWEQNGYVVFLVLWDSHFAMYKAVFPYTDKTFPLVDRAVYNATLRLPTPFIRVYTVGTTRHAGKVATSVRRKLESLNADEVREEIHQGVVKYGLPPIQSR